MIRIRLTTALFLAAALPGLLALSGLALYFSDRLDRLHEAEAADRLLVVAEKLDAVASQHALERGLTAGFIASGGQRFQRELIEQREIADHAISQLRMLQDTGIEGIPRKVLDSKIKPVLDIASRKASIREGVDKLQPAGVFAFYSDLNASALDGLAAVISVIQDPTVSRTLQSFTAIVWARERMGQIRGRLNGYYSQGTADPLSFIEVKQYIGDRDSQIRVFKRFAESAYQLKFEDLQKTADYRSVNSALSEFLKSEGQSALLDPTGGQWFSLATRVLKGYAKLGKEILQAAGEQATDNAVQNRNTLLKVSVAFLLISAVSAILVLVSARVVRNSVSQVTQGLKDINDHSDLTIRLPALSDNEMGQIGAAINSHLTQVTSIFKNFKELSDVISGHIGHIQKTSESAYENTNQQHHRTDQLATAMTELTHSATNIADNMSNARRSMEVAGEQARISLQKSSDTQLEVERLSQEITQITEVIQALSEQSKDIAGILDTITGIAEQTNLLALNAAIEAARAGEQGRGFAVVADEVRALAQKSQGATDSIRDVISRLQHDSDRAVQSMQAGSTQLMLTRDKVNDSSAAVEGVNEEIDRMQDLISQVALAADEQSSVISEIERNAVDIGQFSDDTQQGVASVSQASDELLKHWSSLEGQIRRYQTS